MLGSCKPQDVFNAGTVNIHRYRDGTLYPVSRDAVGPNIIFIEENAKPHRAHILVDFFEEEDIHRMNWISSSPVLSLLQHV